MTSAPGDILDVELPGVERRRGLHSLRPRPQSGRFQVRHQEGIHVLKLFFNRWRVKLEEQGTLTEGEGSVWSTFLY